MLTSIYKKIQQQMLKVCLVNSCMRCTSQPVDFCAVTQSSQLESDSPG